MENTEFNKTPFSGITLSAGQFLSAFLAVAAILASIAYGAGTYSTQFTNLKNDTAKQQETLEKIEGKVNDLSIDIKELRRDFNASKR